MTKSILQILGIDNYRVSHTERFVSMGGAFTGILAVFLISAYFLGAKQSYFLVASMGASAVLLFAVPHGALSQPWPLVGGHLVSAAIGVTCAQLIPNLYIAAPLAVGLAVGAMYYLRCIHPPGGATALTAVIGGAETTALGYGFVAMPVLINVSVLLIIAVTFNYPFAWRRYPAYLNRRKVGEAAGKPPGAIEPIGHESFVYALSEIDSFIDVTENDLLRIYDLVVKNRENEHFNLAALALGHCYSNGKYGDQWSVRQIVDWAEEAALDERRLIYKVVAGADRRSTGVASIQEFARWAKYEVFRDEENWRRVSGQDNGV